MSTIYHDTIVKCRSNRQRGPREPTQIGISHVKQR